jgi:hypothetical protein
MCMVRPWRSVTHEAPESPSAMNEGQDKPMDQKDEDREENTASGRRDSGRIA